MPEPLYVFCAVAFGIIGIGYTNYGRRENFYFTLAGIALMTYTFVVTGTMAVLFTGIGLVIAPFILTKFF